MTGKQSAVMWIGLSLILVNFWASGASSSLWDLLTNKSSETLPPLPKDFKDPFPKAKKPAKHTTPGSTGGNA